MLNSASKIKALRLLRKRLGWVACPTPSRVQAAGGTEKVPADWAFVSGVSPVSPNLKLIEDYRNEEWESHGRALVGATPHALRRVDFAQSPQTIVVRQHGRDTGETGGTRQSHSRCKGMALKPCEPLWRSATATGQGNPSCKPQPLEKLKCVTD